MKKSFAERISRWWKTPPNKDDFFFVNIRESYQTLFGRKFKQD